MLAQATNWLDAVVHAWSSWMWDMSLHVTWLVVLLWLLDRPLQRTSARLRFVLWTLVLVRLVVPPTLMLPTGIGWWCGDWFAQHAQSWTLTRDTAPLAASATGGDVLRTAANSTGHARDWASLLFTLWLGSALAQLAWISFGWLQIRRWLKQSTLLADTRSQRVLADALARVGIDGRVELRDSGQCTTPLVIGCLRPIILLPTAVRESLSMAELESVLVHELTHIARRDSWWRLVQAFLGVLYCFHPAVWLARYKLNQLCEEACDEQTVWALAGERRDYAQAIVKAATIIGYQPPHLAVNMVGSPLPVKRRLQRILDPAFPWAAGGRWHRASLVILLALVLLPSGYRSSRATPPDRLRQAGLPSVEVLPSFEANLATAEATTADPIRDEELERQALAQLKSTDFETRLAAYQALESIGTLNSLSELESAFLNRRGIEQDAAKRALDRVWSIIRNQASETTQSSRQFRNNEES